MDDTFDDVMESAPRAILPPMQTVEEVVAPLIAKSFEEMRPIAREIGLDVETVYAIVQGHTRRPSYEFVRRIATWIESQPKIKPKRRLAK